MAVNLEKGMAEDSDVTSSEESDEKQNKSSYKRYVCPEDNCTATFKRPDRLQCHMRKHTGERPFVCLYDECDKSYARASHLKRHEQKVHQAREDAPLTCLFPKCEKQFKSQYTLNKHIKNIHEERKYVCRTCLKPFRKHQHLKIHEYDHTGIKPFPCSHPGCDKSFVLPSRLKRHLKTHAGMEEKEAMDSGYKCDAYGCNAMFRTWTLLSRHRKGYHPTTYSCDICKRTFNTRYNLQLHLKIHEEERETFHCPHPDCPRYYLHEKNLTMHLRSYHEEREFHCIINGCKAHFAHKVSLKKHIECHNEELPSKKKEKKKESKSNEVKKPKRRRKRRPSISMGEHAAVILSGFGDKSMTKTTLQGELCHLSGQQNVNNMTNDNDSHLSDQQNVDALKDNDCHLLSKLNVNVNNISDCIQQNMDSDSCHFDCSQHNTESTAQSEHPHLTICDKQNVKNIIRDKSFDNSQYVEHSTENKAN